MRVYKLLEISTVLSTKFAPSLLLTKIYLRKYSVSRCMLWKLKLTREGYASTSSLYSTVTSKDLSLNTMTLFWTGKNRGNLKWGIVFFHFFNLLLNLTRLVLLQDSGGSNTTQYESTLDFRKCCASLSPLVLQWCFHGSHCQLDIICIFGLCLKWRLMQLLR